MILQAGLSQTSLGSTFPACSVFPLGSHVLEFTVNLCTVLLEHNSFVASRTKCSMLLQFQFHHPEVQQKEYFVNIMGSADDLKFYFNITLLLQRSLCLTHTPFVKHVDSGSFSLAYELFVSMNYSCLIVEPPSWFSFLNFIFCFQISSPS